MSPAGIKECERGESRCGHQINGQRHVSVIVAKNIASGDQHGNFFPSNRKPQLKLHVSVGFGLLVAGARYGERHTSPYRALRPWVGSVLRRRGVVSLRVKL